MMCRIYTTIFVWHTSHFMPESTKIGQYINIAQRQHDRMPLRCISWVFHWEVCYFNYLIFWKHIDYCVLKSNFDRQFPVGTVAKLRHEDMSPYTGSKVNANSVRLIHGGRGGGFLNRSPMHLRDSFRYVKGELAVYNMALKIKDQHSH